MSTENQSKFSIKDITVLTAVIGMTLSLYKCHKEEAKEVKVTVELSKEAEHTREVTQALTRAMHSINEQILFRSPTGQRGELSIVNEELLKEAKRFAPNDPFVITYGLYNRLVPIARDPKRENITELVALSTYPRELRKAQGSNFETLIEGVFEDWMTISAGAMLNIIVRGQSPDKDTSRMLYNVSYDCLSDGLDQARQNNDKRRILRIASVVGQHALRGIREGFSAKSGFEAIVDEGERIAVELKASEDRLAQITGFDGYANLLHLRGQARHLGSDFEGATSYYKRALEAYLDLKSKFPDRYNPREEELVRDHLAEAESKRALGASHGEETTAEQDGGGQPPTRPESK